ncbi:hypothetical protein HMPREF1860_01726 [Prevotella amnii]|uniref:Uncharacterized protein n=1 Tax=Prevotella amnii TaxID=419005 RepID=A0A134B6X4_9BACT|nr:hypothetical protein HMPREF1860_01726 [Prevotella amnii]
MDWYVCCVFLDKVHFLLFCYLIEEKSLFFCLLGKLAVILQSLMAYSEPKALFNK